MKPVTEVVHSSMLSVASRNIFQSALAKCNSITLDRPLAHTRVRTRDPLHTSTTVTLEASLPIAPQKPRLLQRKGKYYFKVSEQVTSPIETLFSANTAN